MRFFSIYQEKSKKNKRKNHQIALVVYAKTILKRRHSEETPGKTETLCEEQD